jgi:hypothetical protein
MAHIRLATENGVIVDFDIACALRDRQGLRRKFLEYITSADPQPDRRGALGAANDDESPIRAMTPSRMRELLAQGNPLWTAIWEDAISAVA